MTKFMDDPRGLTRRDIAAVDFKYLLVQARLGLSSDTIANQAVFMAEVQSYINENMAGVKEFFMVLYNYQLSKVEESSDRVLAHEFLQLMLARREEMIAYKRSQNPDPW